MPTVTELHTTQITEPPHQPRVTQLHTTQVPEPPHQPSVTQRDTTQVPGPPRPRAPLRFRQLATPRRPAARYRATHHAGSRATAPQSAAAVQTAGHPTATSRALPSYTPRRFPSHRTSPALPSETPRKFPDHRAPERRRGSDSWPPHGDQPRVTQLHTTQAPDPPHQPRLAQ